jgi:hypothetical protein
MSQHLPSTEGDGRLRLVREATKKATESPKVTSSRKGASYCRTKTIQKKRLGGEEQLVNVVKAAKMLGVKRSVLRDLAYRGQIPGLIIGGAIFLRMSHIESSIGRMTKKAEGGHNGPTIAKGIGRSVVRSDDGRRVIKRTEKEASARVEEHGG